MKNLANLEPFEYCRILWRRRWYALVAFLLAGIGTAIYSWRTPDVYRSQSLIKVEQAVIPQDYARPSDRSTPEEQIAGIRDAVQSRSFAERLIQEFQLFGYGSSSQFSMGNATEALAKTIEVVSTSPSTFEISASSNDPQLSQTIVRRVVDMLTQSSTSSRKARAVEADQFLDEQLRQIEQKLLDHEEKIKQFKLSHMGGLPEQSVANMNALNGLNAQLATLEDSLQNLRDQQKQLDAAILAQKKLDVPTSSMDLPVQSAPAESETKKANVSNPQLEAAQKQLRDLSLKYTANHPDVVRLSREVEQLKSQAEASNSVELGSTSEGQEKPGASIDDLNSILGSVSIPETEAAGNQAQAEAIKGQIARREKERNEILAQIRTYQGRLNLVPALEQEYMGLSREYEFIKQQYSNLQGKKSQAELTTNLETSRNNETYRIVDEANLPERPSFPNRKQIFLLGLCGGIVLGIGAAFGRELLDPTFGSEDEATAVLKLPVLASIREMPQKEPKRLSRINGIAKSA